MDPFLFKRNHQPYRRGERRRKPFAPEVQGQPRFSGVFVERSAPAMYDLLVVVVALVTFVALAGFVYFCERI